MEAEIPKNASLLQCTFKKSQHVFKKVIKYVIYLFVAGIIAYAGYLGLPVIIPVIIQTISTAIGIVWGIVGLVPWYVYAGIGVIAAIPLYSFLWCIARELTDEDWESETAKKIAVFAVLALPLTVLALFALAVFAVLALFALAVFPHKSMLFIGAVWHYWKRTQKQNNEV